MPPLPHRARPLQVVLGVGAVLVVSGAAAVVAVAGGAPARLPLLGLAGVAAGFSVRAARGGLSSTGETLAACAAGLGLTAGGGGGSPRAGSAAVLAAVALVCLLLHRLAPGTAGWPLAAWAALQLAVLRTVDAVPDPLSPPAFLAVALAGLAVALCGRPSVARLALVTSVPWWVAGVLGGTAAAWRAPGAERHLAALLVVAAAAGLLPARLRAELDPLLGPPRAVPVLAGIVAGVGVSGAFAAVGTPGITAAGYLGLLVATVSKGLSGWRRGLFGPVAVAGGSVAGLAALLQLAAGAQWAAVSLLLLLTAVPAALVARRRPEERPALAPTAVGCLTGAVLLLVPAGLLGPGAAAAVLTGLTGAGLAAAAALARSARRPTLTAANAAAVAALALAVPVLDREPLALLLAVQGLLTAGWAGWTARAGGARPSPAWRVGAALLTLAAWLALPSGGVHALEAYTLPLAVGLLLAQGPRLMEGPSWPAWGPGLLVAAGPSAVMAVLLPGSTRPIAVLATAAAAMLLAGATGVRAPLEIGAATAVGTGLALVLATLLWPVAATLAIGAVLLAVGARRERLPVGSFGSRLADLR